jgi:hypothetical protein
MCSGGAAKGNARQVTTLGHEGDAQLEPCARLAFDQSLWAGAGRSAWPTRSGFPPRGTAGGPASKVDFVRRRPVQGHVWPILVVEPVNTRPL